MPVFPGLGPACFSQMSLFDTLRFAMMYEPTLDILDLISAKFCERVIASIFSCLRRHVSCN
jgi:hypothetical protein